MLRRLRKDDLKELHSKLNNLSDQDKKFFHPHSFEMDDLKELLSLNYDYYFVEKVGESIVGYSFLRTFGKYEIPTFGGVVWQKYRGQGYGSKILEKTLDEAKKIGFKSVKLKVYEDNKVAFNLYKKHGFKKIGIEDKQIWMEKNLMKSTTGGEKTDAITEMVLLELI